MNIYVGNLSAAITEGKLQELFSSYGIVESVKIILDRYTNAPRGFAFVEMPNISEGRNAINELNETNVDSQFITVNEARPRKERYDSYNRY